MSIDHQSCEISNNFVISSECADYILMFSIFMTENWFNDERKTFLHTSIFLSNILPMQEHSGCFVLIALISEGALAPY